MTPETYAPEAFLTPDTWGGEGLVTPEERAVADAAEWKDIPAAELGYPETIEEKFRAVNNWAGERGYVGAFPNFHWADYGNGVVYGTVLLKAGTSYEDPYNSSDSNSNTSEISSVAQQYNLGNPTSEITQYSNDITYQTFENGSVVSSSYGTYPLYGGIRAQYLSTGGLIWLLGRSHQCRDWAR